MDINNIALVRATDIIPYNGVINPISNSQYLNKGVLQEFDAAMSDLLYELNLIPPIDYSKISNEEDYNNMVISTSKIINSYFPYTSDYSSIVLFSLNGLCPDDKENGFGNNTFSDKKCAIIEPLNQHLEQIISIVTTDTALKGDVFLSSDAIILIDKQTFANLSEQQKNNLRTLNLTVQQFQGSIKDAVIETLNNTHRYTPETLSLSSSDGGIVQSKTSEGQKKLISDIANEYGLSQKKYFNLITSYDKTMPKYDEVSNEYSNMMKVKEYFMIMFLEKLLIFLNAPDNIINNISINLHNKQFYLEIMQRIKTIGIDNYKQFLDNYNLTLLQQQKEGTLIKPQEIIDNYFSKRQL